MIEISFSKLVLLALVALIVLGPEKLPGAARTAGALLRRIRGGWDSVRAEVERELEIEEIKRSAREAAERAEALQNQLKDGVQQVHGPLEKVVDEAAGMVRPESSDSGGSAAGEVPAEASSQPAEPARNPPA